MEGAEDSLVRRRGDEPYENDFALSDRWIPPRYLLVEFMGTFFYTLISAGCVISCGVFTYQFTTDEMNPARHIAIAFANSFAFAAMLYVGQSFQDNAAKRVHERGNSRQTAGFASYPVGHFNPAITFAVALLGTHNGADKNAPKRLQLSPAQAMLYVTAQCLGSVVAGAVLFLSYPFAHHSTMGASIPSYGMGATKWSALYMELILTFFLVLASLIVGVHGERFHEDPNDKYSPVIRERGGAPNTGTGWAKYMSPLCILFCMMACSIVGSPVSGLSLNPARSFGPAIFSGVWIDHWIYWVGPMGGGLAAAGVYKLATLGQVA